MRTNPYPDLTPDEIRRALAHPGSFGYHGDLPLFTTWSLGPVIETRDSGALDRSNARVLKRELETHPEWEDDYAITHTGHWAVGWVDHLSYRVVNPDGSASEIARFLAGWFAMLDDYPIADDGDFAECEMEEANETWRECYGVKERISYVRENREQFEFRSLADMLGCVRGEYFAGEASELLS